MRRRSVASVKISYRGINMGPKHVYTKAMLGISVQLSLTQLAKTLCLPYYFCVFSSTKLVIKAEQDLPGTEGERVGMG
jgi:hypothetical protein